MALKVRSLNAPYRGFATGYVETSCGYKAAWRSSLEKGWSISRLIADSNELSDVLALAQDCVDEQYREEARQVEQEMCKNP